MEEIKKEEEMRMIKDQWGDEVPAILISPKDLERHDLVEGIFNKITEMKGLMLKTSQEIDDIIDRYLTKQAKRANVDGWKGNVTLTNFTGNKQVVVAMNDLLEFNENLNVAKMKVDQCVKRWVEEDDSPSIKNLAALVNSAFSVDKKGDFNKAQIMKLLNIHIKDKEWISAQKLIKDSFSVRTTKKYKRFKLKNEDGKLEGINLNFNTF